MSKLAYAALFLIVPPIALLLVGTFYDGITDIIAQAQP